MPRHSGPWSESRERRGERGAGVRAHGPSGVRLALGAAMSLGLAVVACSDGTEQWLARTRGAATGTSGSDTGATAGSPTEMPPPGGSAGMAQSAGSGGMATGGSAAAPTGGTGTGGSQPEAGGTNAVAGSSTGGSDALAGGGSGGASGSGGSGGSEASPFKVLVISTALEFPHDSIGECQKMVRELGAADPINGWSTLTSLDDLLGRLLHEVIEVWRRTARKRRHATVEGFE